MRKNFVSPDIMPIQHWAKYMYSQAFFPVTSCRRHLQISIAEYIYAWPSIDSGFVF
jgi:hypothetical protein